MSDCFGSTRHGRVEWSIPMDNYADQIYRLLGIMESEAAKHGIDTHYGDWFRAEVRDYEHRERIVQRTRESGGDEDSVGKYQLTLWFELPGEISERTP